MIKAKIKIQETVLYYIVFYLRVFILITVSDIGGAE